MKQQITIQDLADLSKENLDRYMLWCEMKGMHLIQQKTSNFETGIEEEKLVYPLLTIGQMIEILDEQDVMVDITEMWNQSKIEDLCDALWKAVKEALNEL